MAYAAATTTGGARPHASPILVMEGGGVTGVTVIDLGGGLPECVDLCVCVCVCVCVCKSYLISYI